MGGHPRVSIKINPIGIEFFERVYDQGSSNLSEEEVATIQSIPVTRIMAMSISRYEISKSSPEDIEKIKRFAKEQGIPLHIAEINTLARLKTRERKII